MAEFVQRDVEELAGTIFDVAYNNGGTYGDDDAELSYRALMLAMEKMRQATYKYKGRHYYYKETADNAIRNRDPFEGVSALGGRR